ncbi:MAG: aminoacyl-tRNA hydrolase [Rickettsiales bacterium]|jgi:PTH1 family peptidyl-tRNA hydrolase|nr:aminoacyl-tRNA hydrolase [Rickettsiales bacterium]
MTYLIIGLGNPGKKYEQNRHNAGALAVDFMCKNLDRNYSFLNEHKSQVCKYNISAVKTIFAKPMTYMNLSGDAVLSLANFYKIPADRIIVIHDEIDLPFGIVKNKIGGSAAGHNGIRDIDAKLGKNYHRIRIGIEHPKNISGIENIPVADYVLSNFTRDELQTLNDEIFSKAFDAVKEIIKSSV